MIISDMKSHNLHYSGIRSRVDVGVVDQEGRDSHYFINVADVHL